MEYVKITNLKTHPEDFISIKQAAEYLKVSSKMIQRQIDKRALPARKFGGQYKILITDFQRYVGSTDEHPSSKLR